MKIAIIDRSSNIVLNVAVCDASTPKLEGYTCVILPDDFYVGPGFIYTTEGTFEPPVKTVIDA